MGKKFKGKCVSVRGSSDYLDVRLFINGQIVFKGGCNPNDPAKVKSLFELLKAKGLMSADDDWW